MKKRINLKKIVFLSVVSISLLVLVLFFYSFFIIYKDVKVACLQAKSEYKRDCVNSLIMLIQSDDHSFRQRNSAIWALGQLADKKALLFLYELGKSLPEQKRCRYDKYLCKYEVQKAIRWCEEGNITSWMYKNRESW